jgi:hypothetical protein
MDGFLNFVIQIKSLLTVIVSFVGVVYFIKSGALEAVTGSYKRSYEATKIERDELKLILAIRDARIKELDDYIKILILNDKTKMEIEMQRHDKQDKNA